MLEDCSPPLHSSARRWCFSQRHRFKPKRRCQNKCTEQAKPSIRHHFASRCLAQLFGCSLNFLIQASSALRNIAQDRCQEQATSIHCAIRAGHSGATKVLKSRAFVLWRAGFYTHRAHLCCKNTTWRPQDSFRQHPARVVRRSGSRARQGPS